MDVAQGVHDALNGNASQRPAAEREVESLAPGVECLRRVRAESNSTLLLHCQCGLSRKQVLLTRVEGVDRRVSRCGKGCQTAIATADVKNALPSQRDEMVDGGTFDASLVTAIHV